MGSALWSKSHLVLSNDMAQDDGHAKSNSRGIGSQKIYTVVS